MSTRYRGTRAEVRALDAWIKLNRAVESVGARLRQAMDGAGVTLGQFAVLEALTDVSDVAVSQRGSCVIRRGGSVHCWGAGLVVGGEIPVSSTTSTPVRVRSLR